MSVWFDDLARRLGSVEEGRLSLGRISRRKTLAKVLGAAIAASPLAALNLLPRSTRAGDRCNNNRDCRENQRCRHGRCERDGNGGGGGGGNDKWERAGKSSRDAGVEEWKLDKTPSGYDVSFRHQKNNLSGDLKVTYSDGGRTGGCVLTRDQDRFQLAFSGQRLSVTDAKGQSMVARWDDNRTQWDIDAQSKRAFEDNKRDLEIAFAIAADLSESWSRSDARSEAVSAERQGICDESREMLGVAADWLKSRACDWATKDVNRQCENEAPACDGCCRVLNECTCFCPLGYIPGLSEFVCNCLRVGHPYPRNGAC